MILTTTGTQPTVTIASLGLTLTHPETRNLLEPDSLWDVDDVASAAVEIEAARAAGEITVTNQAGQPVEDAVQEGVAPDTHKQVSMFSGRWYCYTDNRWCGFSNVYGHSYYQYNFGGGTGAEPSVAWDANGIWLPRGTKLKSLTIKGRSSNTEVTDMELYLRTHQVDYALGADIDSVGEVNAQTILAPTALNLVNGGADLSDMHAAQVDLGGFQLQHDGDVLMYLRPVGSLTSTRYFYGTTCLEVELP